MSNFISYHEFFKVPYNGTISILSYYVFLRGRKVLRGRTVTWYKDDVALVVDKSGVVNHQTSKVRLLRAIYRAGYSVLGMSKRRLEAESHRMVQDFPMKPFMAVVCS